MVSRDRQQSTEVREAYGLVRCRSGLNCVEVCPKCLFSAAAIISIKDMMARGAVRVH